MRGFAVSDAGLPKHTLSDYRNANPYELGSKVSTD